MEENRDGHDHNISWNCSVEGETDDAEVLALRARQQRNFLATLLLSQGVPMLVAGDEIGRTQRGNNNAWCQDNEISWIDWSLDQSKQDLLEFTRRLIHLFHTHPVLRRRKFFQGRQIRGGEIKDISWFRPDGQEMAEGDWKNEQSRSLGVRLAGDAIDETDERGHRITDDTLLLLLNAHHRSVSFVLPAHRDGDSWEQLLDTRESFGRRKTRRAVRGGGSYRLEARSLALFRLQTIGDAALRAEEHDVEFHSEAVAGMQPLSSDETTLEGVPTETVYCARADAIVPLDEGFCRACSEQVADDDGIHRRPTPEMMKELGYATTASLPDTEAEGEESAPEDEPQE
jgi:hypothetical protein